MHLRQILISILILFLIPTLLFAEAEEDEIILPEVVTYIDAPVVEQRQVFTAEVRSNDDRISMVPVYVLVGIISSVGMAFYGFLISKRESLTDYTLHKWKDLQDESVYR